MSSFTMKIKNEICQKEFDANCQKALLAAFLQVHSSVETTLLEFPTYHKETKELLIKFLEKQFQGIEFTVKIKNHQKRVSYNFIFSNDASLKLQKQLMLNQKNNYYFEQKDLRKEVLRAYIAGLFLASGSINTPETPNYHLELQFSDNKMALKLEKFIVKKFNFAFKTIVRRNKTVLYLKKSNDISDFLKLLDCPEAVFAFEDQRITRELLNTINRFHNIDISNQQKILETAMKQVKMIKFLQKENHFSELSFKCQTLANLRLKHQEASLAELSLWYEKSTKEIISKSGVNHLTRELKKKYDSIIVEKEKLKKGKDNE